LLRVCIRVLKPRARRRGGAAGRALNLLSCLLGGKLLFTAALRPRDPGEAGALKENSDAETCSGRKCRSIGSGANLPASS